MSARWWTAYIGLIAFGVIGAALMSRDVVVGAFTGGVVVLGTVLGMIGAER